jgi:hypothetical protein
MRVPATSFGDPPVKNITTAQVADRLERTARLIAPAIAFIITAALLLTELSYALGYQLGQAVHARNDQLSRLWVRLWAPEPELAPEPAAEQPEPAAAPPAAPAQHPLMALAADLEQLTCKQLRSLTGCRRKLPKAQLIHLAIAMA